jgi:hypothetical protein
MKSKFQYIILVIFVFILLFIVYYLSHKKVEPFTPYIRGIYRPYARGLRIHGSNVFHVAKHKVNRFMRNMRIV